MSQGESQYDAPDPLVGRVLSERYRVKRLIGEGGIGRVYLAEHIGTNREVALKVLLPEFAGNLQLVDTFLEEAPPMLAELNDALGAGRAEPFRRAAHSLKSNASTFGALTLAAMARDLELQGIAAATPAALSALAQHYDQVSADLKALRDA